MGHRKRWKRDWHHRAPDFKLVYCGPKKSVTKDETGQPEKRRTVELAVATDRNGVAFSKLERKKSPEKVKQLHVFQKR